MESGVVRTYYNNGQLCSECFQLNYKNEGEMKGYYKNGKLSLVCNYIDGLRYGEWKSYNEDETLSEEGLYYKDKKIGKWYSYFEGSMNHIIEYIDNEERVYNSDNKIIIIGKNIDGINGEYTYFNDDD